MNHNQSLFRFYSIAIVAANKKLSSDKIEAVPMEDSPMLDGELSDHVEQYQAKSTSADKQSYQSDLKTTASIEARWLPLGNDNRLTPPDVRRGEYVMLYRYADTDEYWWVSLKQDNTLRRLETVIYSYSNERQENKQVKADNSYWIEISTHNKLIHLHTSKNDNEPFVYDIQINTKEGCITIQDDDNNYIFLDSKERQIKLHNRDDSFIDIDKKKIHINALDEIKLTTRKYILNASESITNTTRDYRLDTSSYKVSASSYSTITPDAHYSANITLGASLTAGGRVSASHIHGNSYSGGHHD